mmetsp:Transcript_12657/g.22720  ORF Transcript_12657/g.22720 Transcript_12657/m.22720 type:complete len:107 (+) Transcript_12657:137-457(+)
MIHIDKWFLHSLAICHLHFASKDVPKSHHKHFGMYTATLDRTFSSNILDVGGDVRSTKEERQHQLHIMVMMPMRQPPTVIDDDEKGECDGWIRRIRRACRHRIFSV